MNPTFGADEAHDTNKANPATLDLIRPNFVTNEANPAFAANKAAACLD